MSVNSSTFHTQQLCRALRELEVQSNLIMGRDKGKTCSLVVDIHRSQASSLLMSVLTLNLCCFSQFLYLKKKETKNRKISLKVRRACFFLLDACTLGGGRGWDYSSPPACLHLPQSQGRGSSEHFLVQHPCLGGCQALPSAPRSAPQLQFSCFFSNPTCFITARIIFIVKKESQYFSSSQHGTKTRGNGVVFLKVNRS